MLRIVYHLGPNHELVCGFLYKASLLTEQQRRQVADRWQRRVSRNRDEYIRAALHQAIVEGRFGDLVNAGLVIAANHSLYALDPDGIVFLNDKLEFANGTWIRALKKAVEILVISDLLDQELEYPKLCANLF